ncbi:hypothetical protein ACADC178_1728 [Lactobacillus delbrueckii subsp. lactis]|nr:hypothetical protein ACADC178_1728 [Lactobacillus delbrueckii subsp. lactis]
MEPVLVSEPGAVVEPLALLPGVFPAELLELELVELLVEVSLESVLTFLVLIYPRLF